MALFPEKAEVIFVGEDAWVVSYFVALSRADLTLILTASSPTRRKIVYISRYSIVVPTDAHGINTVLTLSLPRVNDRYGFKYLLSTSFFILFVVLS